MREHKSTFKVIACAWLFAVGTAAVISYAQTARGDDFGAKVGAEWAYAITYSDGSTSNITKRSQRALQVKGKPVLELATKVGKYDGFEYMACDSEGLHEYFNSQMRGPGVAEEVAPIPVLKMPATPGKKWEYEVPFRGQLSGAADIDPSSLRTFAIAKIVNAAEEVQVPAGKFVTIHVQTDHRSGTLGNYRTDRWYSTHVGLVKEVTTGKDGKTQVVLVSHKPASD